VGEHVALRPAGHDHVLRGDLVVADEIVAHDLVLHDVAIDVRGDDPLADGVIPARDVADGRKPKASR